MRRLVILVLFAIGMIATVNAQFVDGQLYYGSQAMQLDPRLQNGGLDPNGIYVYRASTNMLDKYCPTCPTAPVAPTQPYVQPIQPYYPPAPAPAPTTTYVVVETQRDGAAKFRDIGTGFGFMAVGAGSVMTGVAGLQGKLGTNVYTTVYGGGGGPWMGGTTGGNGGPIIPDNDPRWNGGVGYTNTGNTGGGGPAMWGTTP